MICGNCGKQMPDNATFCSNCGHSLKEDYQQEADEQFESNGEQYNYFSVYNILQGKAIVAIVAGIVGLCTTHFIIGIVAWIAGRRALWDDQWNPLAKAGRILGIIDFFLGLFLGVLSLFGISVIGSIL